MNRDMLLAAKAAEITRSLQSWARDNLSAGEQLLVSLRIQDVPAAAIDPEDATVRTTSLLGTKVLAFFTLERLEASLTKPGIAVRVHNCFTNDTPLYKNMTMGEFVETISQAELLRGPNFGRDSLALVIQVLKEAGLELRR